MRRCANMKRLPNSALLVACLLLTGCYSSYNLSTQREEVSFTSTEREMRMGAAIAKRVFKGLPLVDDEAIQARVRAIGARLAAVSDRQELPYEFHVLEGEEINAFTIPGGYVFVNEGLVDFAKDDDQLASVIAHEIGHTAARHPVKRYETFMASSLGQAIVAGVARDAALSRGTNVIFTFLFLEYSREDELLADRLAVGYLREAGFQPDAMVTFMERLKRREQGRPRPKSYFRTHPYMADRVSVVREAATGALQFEDYINRSDE